MRKKASKNVRIAIVDSGISEEIYGKNCTSNWK
jgi:hypothetical protein